MTGPTHDEQRPRTRANRDESGGTVARRARRLLRALTARPRLLSSVAVGIVVFLALPGLPSLHLAARALVAWNAGAGLYLLLVFRMIRGDGVEGIRRRALRQDDGRIAVLVLTVASALAVLLAVGSQLATVKDLHGAPRAAHILLAALTVVSSWSFTQALFALHYAHEFHLARVRGQPDPLSFPGTAEPLYRDFVYFACVIGTSGQTADVSFSGSSLRGVGTVHCVLAYFFNATLLALAINIAAGLL